MANFTPTKKQVSDFNNGIKYVNKVDTPSADDFNNVIESQLYSQNFAESLADTPDTSEASQVGVPSVTLINNIKNGVAYKKFKFANMKGDPGGVAPVENSQSNNTNTVPSSKLLRESSFSRVYRSLAELGLTATATAEQVSAAMRNNSIALFSLISTDSLYPSGFGFTALCEVLVRKAASTTFQASVKTPNATTSATVYGVVRDGDTSNKWSGWKQIIDDSTAQDITGVKTFKASPIVPTTPSGPSAAVSKSYTDSVGFARVYRRFADLGIPNSSTIAELHSAMIDRSRAIIPVSTYDHPTYGNTGLELPNDYFYVLEAIRQDDERLTLKLVGKTSNSAILYQYEGMYWDYGVSNKFTGWKRVIDDSSAQTITGVKTFATGATPLITDQPTTALMAVNKSYVDSLTYVTVYDRVIHTQAEFDALIGSETWLGATSVALVGQFTLSTTDNSGIKIPATVKQIHGFNSAKITITNFVYDSTTAKGGLWYDTAPTTQDYSIRDLEVSCTATIGSGYGFVYCNNLSNCTGTGTGTAYGYGFSRCNNLSNCTGTGTGTGTGSYSYGYGFSLCKNLSNCTGTGTGGNGYGFYNINYAVNCKDGGSSTNMWGGTNKNIDLDTCRKTPVQVTAAELTTLNT